MPVDNPKPLGFLPLDRKEPFVSAQQQFFRTTLKPAPTRKKAQQRKSEPTNVPKAAAKSRNTNGAPCTCKARRDGETAQEEEHHVEENAAPLVKLASKVKFMLRRRSGMSEKKKEKKEKDYYDPEENLHWTER